MSKSENLSDNYNNNSAKYMSNQILLTNQIIEEFKTKNNGYTKQQLHILGIQWPPIKGWKKELIKRDTHITKEEYMELLHLSNTK
jgi:hypothetical protein